MRVIVYEDIVNRDFPIYQGMCVYPQYDYRQIAKSFQVDRSLIVIDFPPFLRI